MIGEQDIGMKLSTAFPLRGSFSQLLSLFYSLKNTWHRFYPIGPYRLQWRLVGAYPALRPVGLGLQIFAGLITLPLVINYGLFGSAKKLRAQSVAEVSAYYSWVLFSGYVEMKVSQAYSNKTLATLLACINTVEIVQRIATRWVLNLFDRKDRVTL